MKLYRLIFMGERVFSRSDVRALPQVGHLMLFVREREATY